MEVLSMRLRAALVAAALVCPACGLFLDDLSKGNAADAGTDTETGTEVTGDPCDGVDLVATPCCDVNDPCGWVDDTFCDCPTCAWDALDCGLVDGGAGDAGPDAGG
jgi:hypothetical protein